MNISKDRYRHRITVLGALFTAISLAISSATHAATVEARTTFITACGKLFAIDANAAGLSADERARIVQKRLDDALVAAKNRTPAAVKVQMFNNNPVVTLDNYLIVTADGNSAARNRMTQMQLAEKWADSLKLCLSDIAAINSYISMLTGKYPAAKVSEGPRRMEVAVAPAGQIFPINLANNLIIKDLNIGDAVQAVVSTDVPLQTSFATYLPAGTVAMGEVVSASSYAPNNFPSKNATTIKFSELRTPDGERIPIDGFIVGGVDNWRFVAAQPSSAECCVHNVSSFGPAKGEVGGGWRGLPVDQQTQSANRRLFLTHNSGLVIPSGVPMFLQLNASTTIAVKSPRAASM